jgi:peptide/nickel transport system substrate-binding protein
MTDEDDLVEVFENEDALDVLYVGLKADVAGQEVRALAKPSQGEGEDAMPPRSQCLSDPPPAPATMVRAVDKHERCHLSVLATMPAMDGRTLVLPMRSTRVSLESDRPMTGVYHVTHHAYDALAAPAIRRLPDGRYFADFDRISGRLAERFEPNDDFSRWRVVLRRGVRSHAGNELTSDDILWSYARAFALRAIGMWRLTTVAGVPPTDGIRALDRSTVEFRIEGANPHFPRYLCYGTCAIIDSVEAQRHATVADPWASAYLAAVPCGFGAFDLASQDDERLRFVPRRQFWAGAPPVEAVEYRAAPERQVGLDLFARGEANCLVGLTPDEAVWAGSLPGVTLRLARTNHATLEFNRERPPFDRREAREAVLRTIPYERIIAEGSLGFAERQTGLFQPNTPGNLNGDWPYPPDRERSRRLVRAAGASGATIVLATVRSPEAERIAAIVREALATIDLVVEHRAVEDLGGALPDLFLRDDCSHGIADPHYDIAIDFAPPRDMPFRTLKGPRLSADLREIRRAPAAEQASRYRALNDRLLADAAWAPLSGHTYVIAHRELDPWFLSDAYLPLTSLHWNAARYVLPPYR